MLTTLAILLRILILIILIIPWQRVLKKSQNFTWFLSRQSLFAWTPSLNRLSSNIRERLECVFPYVNFTAVAGINIGWFNLGIKLLFPFFCDAEFVRPRRLCGKRCIIEDCYRLMAFKLC